jgi:hypothetical protein
MIHPARRMSNGSPLVPARSNLVKPGKDLTSTSIAIALRFALMISASFRSIRARPM